MIHSEYYLTRKDGVRLVRIWSDAGMMIRETSGEALYSEVIEPEDSGRIYVETDMPVAETETAEELLEILLGGEAL